MRVNQVDHAFPMSLRARDSRSHPQVAAAGVCSAGVPGSRSAMSLIDELLERQDGVIARRQAIAAGLTPTDIKRRVRRRDWVAVHPGVYVNHTGPLAWRQRAWAAVLSCWPAALDGVSARRAHEGPGRHGADDGGPIHVLVEHRRKVVAPDGVRVRRSRRFREAAQANLSPPRLRYEEAIIDLADRASGELAMVAVLADACGGRRTTAERLRSCVDRMPRLGRRKLLAALLTDVAEGTCSVLEHRYLTAVERAHSLPRGLRQVEVHSPSGRRMFRDVRYGGKRPRWRFIVELDGRLGHTTGRDRDADLERDLDAAVDREETVRLGYGQVFDRACRTARRLERIMQRLGWDGEMTRCPSCPGEVPQDWGDAGRAG